MRLGMTVSLLTALLPCACVAGARKAPTDVVSPELPTLTMYDVRTAEAESALPDAPDAPALVFSAEMPATVSAPRRLTISKPGFSRTVSPLYSVPLINAAMRFGGRNFNTDDGSSINAFAICYRLNARSSVQVIPGDPAPVKLPVASMKNNTGVTVGMVYRLSRRR